MEGSKHRCPLCLDIRVEPLMQEGAEVIYFHCRNCDLRFLNPQRHLDPEQEKARYLTHENNVEDPGYQKFVSPLCELVQGHFPQGSRGLDFGCGTGPVLGHLLQKAGYHMSLYDPYFYNSPETLSQTYDFVCTSEVVEHFYRPHEEFLLLRGLLKEGGALGIMTLLFAPEIDFAHWYYRRDPTHVVFYSAKTFAWICQKFGFTSLEIMSDRLIFLKA